MEPSTRFELVTPSLPRTCSTPELRGLTCRDCATPVERRMNFWSGRRDSNPRPTAWKAVTLPLSYSRCFADFGGERRIRTSVGHSPADLQSAAFDRSAISPFDVSRWSWRRDSNPRPADYKSAALPTELCQHQTARFQRHKQPSTQAKDVSSDGGGRRTAGYSRMAKRDARGDLFRNQLAPQLDLPHLPRRRARFRKPRRQISRRQPHTAPLDFEDRVAALAQAAPGGSRFHATG